MSVIVSPLPFEEFERRDTLPSVDSLRPASCPGCGNPTYAPGQGLGLIGHGAYRRHVLGLGGDRPGLLIWVPRYLCTGCGATTSVLPSAVYPRRQYAGVAILISLVRLLLRGARVAEIRRHITGCDSGHGWRSLSRWRQQLLAPLWGWTARQLGFDGHRANGQSEQTRRLERLLCLHFARTESTDAELAMVVSELALGWSSARSPPG